MVPGRCEIRGATLPIMFVLCTPIAQAAEWYVSASTGKGRDGTLARPVKDIGNISDRLQPGDVINLAGGVYTGRADSGRDEIVVPVRIVGGWDTAFTRRDPWGATKTILSGLNQSPNFVTQARLEINLTKFRGTGSVEIDGMIIDNAGRNRYVNGDAKIARKANPSVGENPTPDSAGILVKAAPGTAVSVQNCVVVNVAPIGGALSVWGGQSSTIVIRNNLVINNTGIGIEANTLWRPRDGKGMAAFTIDHNTVLFTWKCDAFGTTGGHGLQMDSDTVIMAESNIFALADQSGVNNVKACKNLTLKGNLFAGNGQTDLIEFATMLRVASLDDDSALLAAGTGGNVGQAITVAVHKAWADRYAARTVIDRNAAEANVTPKNSWANEVRSILGLPLQAATLNVDSDVWLHKLGVDDAITAGVKAGAGGFGAKLPAASAGLR